MALLKILLVLGVSVNSDASLQKRIIGGQNCDDKERLYHVRLVGSKGKMRTRCGGSLIHPEWILTAAHCWKTETGWTNTAIFKVHPRTAGEQHLVIQHAPMIYTEDGQQYDLMLLKLQAPVTDVPLGQLPDCNNRLKVDDTVQLAGEGTTATGPNNRRSHLQCVNMKVVKISDFNPSSGHVFLTAAPNKDVCHGDSGSAVVFNDMIYGVIVESGRHYACQGPVTNVDICVFTDLIKKTIGLK